MKRSYIPKDFNITVWEKLQPFFEELEKRNTGSVRELEKWLHDCSELGAVVSENMAWRYIKMTCDTGNEELKKSFNDFVVNIDPHIAPLVNDLNKKLMDSPPVKELN